MKLRKKPVTVNGIQVIYGKTTIKDLYKEFHKGLSFVFPIKIKNDAWYVITLKGEMKISNKDILIEGVNGEFYPCKPDIAANKG